MTIPTPETNGTQRLRMSGLHMFSLIAGVLVTASEDFSEFLVHTPGCFFFLGTVNAEKGLTWGHHHPRFDISEEPMSIGIAVMAGTALRYLSQNAD